MKKWDFRLNALQVLSFVKLVDRLSFENNWQMEQPFVMRVNPMFRQTTHWWLWEFEDNLRTGRWNY